MQPEVPALARLEIERPAQGGDELPRRRGVPGERAARLRFLKGDAGRCQLAAQHIAALARIESDVLFFEMRFLIIAGLQVNASDHRFVSRIVSVCGCSLIRVRPSPLGRDRR